jgi:hypothetical protein
MALAVAAATIFTGTPLLIRPAAFVCAAVAVGRRAGIAFASILSGTTVRSGAPVAT